MDDEIRQDESEGQMGGVSDVADTDEPTAQSDSAIAEEVNEDASEGMAASSEGDVPASAELVSAPVQASPMDSAEMAPEPAESGPAEMATQEPEPAPTSDATLEPAMESGAESATETGQAEPVLEEADEMVVGAAEAPAAEAAEAVVEVSQAPAMIIQAQAELDDAGREAAQTGAVEAEDDRHWYVVHCYSGYENKVRHNLEQRIESMGMKDKIFDVVVPTEEEIEVKEGKRRTVERRVFPGYILVQMIMTEESWYVVRNTPGVTGFVGMGNEPTPLRPEEVAQIIRRMEAEAPRVKVTYKIDQKVRIIDGPFNDFIGTVDDIDMERAKVRVMVSFFGRETPVELDFLQVEKA
jgi:transcriptional antiterminator NusG